MAIKNRLSRPTICRYETLYDVDIVVADDKVTLEQLNKQFKYYRSKYLRTVVNSEKTRAEAAIRELKSQIIHVLVWVHIELADLSSISGTSFLFIE